MMGTSIKETTCTLYGCPIRLSSTIQTKSDVLTIQIHPYAMLLLRVGYGMM